MRPGNLRQPFVTAAILGAGILLFHLVVDQVFLAPSSSGQTDTTVPAKQAAAKAGQAAAPAPEDKRARREREALAKRDRDAFEKISDSSQRVNDMILLIMAGSLAILVGSTYLHPPAQLRWLYALFPLGWSFLGAAMYHGLEARATYLAYLVAPNSASRVKWIAELNGELDQQVSHFKFGLGAFAVWLLVYIAWWITQGGPSEEPEQEVRGAYE